MLIELNLLTRTASKSFKLSWRYLRIHVSTLAVVSCAANRTPMMLSAIWSSLKVSPFSSLKFKRWPKKSLSVTLFSFLSIIISPRISLSFFLAFKKKKNYHGEFQINKPFYNVMEEVPPSSHLKSDKGENGEKWYVFYFYFLSLLRIRF